MVRSDEDKVEIIFLYGECGRCFRATTRCFNEIHPDRPIDHKYVSNLIRKFQETHSVKDRIRSGRPTVNENTEIEILAHVITNPQQSLTQISQKSVTPPTTVRRILKKHKFHPYK